MHYACLDRIVDQINGARFVGKNCFFSLLARIFPIGNTLQFEQMPQSVCATGSGVNEIDGLDYGQRWRCAGGVDRERGL